MVHHEREIYLQLLVDVIIHKGLTLKGDPYGRFVRAGDDNPKDPYGQSPASTNSYLRNSSSYYRSITKLFSFKWSNVGCPVKCFDFYLFP